MCRKGYFVSQTIIKALKADYFEVLLIILRKLLLHFESIHDQDTLAVTVEY